LIDRREAIDQPIAIAEPRVTPDIGDAEGMERHGVEGVWQIAGQLEQDLRQEKVAFDHFEELRRFLRRAGRKGARMNL
jgi:hypothetical protein